MIDRVDPAQSCIREAVCIHTKKIYDSCRDKDCVEDLRVYPTRSSQAVLDRKGKTVSLTPNSSTRTQAFIF